MEEIEASPQEQEMLQQAVEIAEDILHGPGPVGDQVAKIVSADPDILVGLGKAAAAVLLAVEQKMQVPDDMKLAVAQEIVGELFAIAAEMGAVSEDEIDDVAMEKTVSAATSEYLRLSDEMGKLDPAKLQADIESTKQAMGGASAQPSPQAPPQQGLFEG